MSFNMDLPERIRFVIDRLEKAGFEAYVVGGCVRDAYLGKQPNDYDITTCAFPEETVRVFRGMRIIETGIKHGTVALYFPEGNIEITTYRVDGSYSDSRHPDSVTFTRTLREDLARRDFTCNAMAYSPSAGLVDEFGGRADADSGLIRCVGDPERRFTEDALRIMRALRFSSVLGFDIEPETSRAIHKMKDRLSLIAAERVSAELLKLLCGENAGRVIEEYSDVLGVFIKDFEKLKGFDQRSEHHDKDLLGHTVATVVNTPPEAGLRLAALLHDIGKLDCMTLDENGHGHFYGHQRESAERAVRTCEGLRLSKRMTRQVVGLVEMHDVRFNVSEKKLRSYAGKYGEEFMLELCLLTKADAAAHSETARERNLFHAQQFEDMVRKVLQSGCLTVTQLAIGGKELLELGYPEGAQIGRVLNILFGMVSSGQIGNTREELLEAAKMIKE